MDYVVIRRRYCTQYKSTFYGVNKIKDYNPFTQEYKIETISTPICRVWIKRQKLMSIPKNDYERSQSCLPLL